MTKLSLFKPEMGKPGATEDVKLVNALTAIEAWANGEIDTTNLKGEGIENNAIKNENIAKTKLSKELQENLATTFGFHVSFGFIAGNGSPEAGGSEDFTSKKAAGAYEVTWNKVRTSEKYVILAHVAFVSGSYSILARRAKGFTIAPLNEKGEGGEAAFQFFVIGK